MKTVHIEERGLTLVSEELEDSLADKLVSSLHVKGVDAESREVYPNVCHSSHTTRTSDASTFDVICTVCGATDQVPGGWGELTKPCTGQPE